MQKAIPSRGTTVIDVTYLCNAQCRYCRWGDSEIPGRVAQSLEKVFIPADTLKILGTERIVISGGEPTLHPQIMEIIRYYAELVDHVIIITNGYGLDRMAVTDLLRAGITGITVSLDSVDAMESFLTRRTPPALHKRILQNVTDAAGQNRDCEIGINCTVSHVTANWMTVCDMLKFGAALDVDFVKFQPIFDDGYVSKNSPDLLLGAEDVDQLLEISSKLDTIRHPPTNPSGFWTDVAALVRGKQIPSRRCALSPSDAISVDGKLSICFWVESSCYGSSNEMPNDHNRVKAGFEAEKQRCNVSFHCFCNQGMEHTWLT